MSRRNILGHLIEGAATPALQEPIKATGGLPERFAGPTGPTFEDYCNQVVAERVAAEAATASLAGPATVASEVVAFDVENFDLV